MNAVFVVYLAGKYLTSWRRQSAIVIAVVAGAVFLYALSNALLDGLALATLEKTVGLAVPHVEVETGDYASLSSVLGSLEGVAAFSPRLVVNALAVKGAKSEGVKLVGVRGDLEPKVTRIDSYLESGEWRVEGKYCVLGSRVASRLEVKSGDELALVLPSGGTVRVRVAGVFETGVFELDSYVIYCGLNLLDDMVKGLNYSVAVRLRDPSLAESVARRLGELGYEARPWTELAGNVLELLEVERFYFLL